LELQSALSNGTATPFSLNTIRLMIGIFDRNNTGTIDFDEFASLFPCINEWQKSFQSFDRDNSGTIDHMELKQALTSFGYRLPEECIDQMIRNLPKRSGQPNINVSLNSNRIEFDDFISIFVKLQTITKAFTQFDKDRTGVIRIKYEDFVGLLFGINI
jgi:Ca2+-binding EF-hand superfamily protein